MLSLSLSRPILFTFIPKPRLRRSILRPLSTATASALTPPTPRTTGLPPSADPTPLFLRAPTHPVPASSLDSFRRRATSLIPPSAPHLHRHLRWFLADASGPAPSTPTDPALHLLRAPLDELEALWRAHVVDRRPFQYVVGNEHWGGLVVAVRNGVLIPRPETEAVVEMVRAFEGFEDGWWADLGTGSGAIAVAVARMLGPRGKVFATDVSEVAIEVARLNVERYGVQVRGIFRLSCVGGLVLGNLSCLWLPRSRYNDAAYTHLTNKLVIIGECAELCEPMLQCITRECRRTG
jgi:release factor glutamine methyltransferase